MRHAVILALLCLLLGTLPAAVQANTPEGAPASALAVAPSIDPTGHGSSSVSIDGTVGKTPGQELFDRTSDASILDPHCWAVMAYKFRHELIVYYKGRLFKIYHAVFGRSREAGTKLWAGDRRTPEGLYVIVKKYPSKRWTRFLRFNYPNRTDRYRYEALRDEGLVPATDGRPAGQGSSIGIHGTDRPILNRSNIDWTTGCVSVENDAVLELDRLLPIGTIVVIEP